MNKESPVSTIKPTYLINGYSTSVNKSNGWLDVIDASGRSAVRHLGSIMTVWLVYVQPFYFA